MINPDLSSLKTNPSPYWFKRKLYGWGWTPARWQGWVTLLLFLVLMIGNAFRIDLETGVATGVPVNFLIETAILVMILLVICYKTGEKPRWQWGVPKKK